MGAETDVSHEFSINQLAYGNKFYEKPWSLPLQLYISRIFLEKIVMKNVEFWISVELEFIHFLSFSKKNFSWGGKISIKISATVKFRSQVSNLSNFPNFNLFLALYRILYNDSISFYFIFLFFFFNKIFSILNSNLIFR